MIQLELINENQLTAPEPNQFSTWLTQVADKLDTQGEVCIKIIDKAESQHLNFTYRGKDKPTNILSFPADIPEFVESTHLGDLAICAAVVEKEAQAQGKSIEHHWAHMSVHGLLHLLGYDHIKEPDAEAMEALEIEILAALGINDPYQ